MLNFFKRKYTIGGKVAIDLSLQTIDVLRKLYSCRCS